MRTCGIDISTYTGLVRLDEDGESMGKVIHCPELKGFVRLQSIARQTRTTLEAWKPELAVIEGFAFANKNSLVILVQCATVVTLVLHEMGIKRVVVPPTSLKKWTTGNGAAKKELMAAKVFEKWGYKSPSDDITDAYALARMGQLPMAELLKIKGVEVGL
jgi:crossover junction endodeoxyribonuclease RuvC